MTERDEAVKGTGRHALRNYLLVSTVVAVVVGVMFGLLNQTPQGRIPTFSPLSGTALSIVLLAIVPVPIIWYLHRTDEHDLRANLWGFTTGAITFMTMLPVWWLLNRSGLLVPPNVWLCYTASAVASGGAWIWLRVDGMWRWLWLLIWSVMSVLLLLTIIGLMARHLL